MKKTARQSRTTPPVVASPVDRPPVSVWEAREYRWPDSHQVVGYLVTEPGDRNRMIGFVSLDDCESGMQRQAEAAAMEYARRMVAVPFLAEAINGGFIDLRDVGRIDSTREVPGWLYGLYLAPVPDDAKEADSAAALVAFDAMCPVRLKRMVEQFCARRFPREDLAALPVVSVARFEEADPEGAPSGRCVMAEIVSGAHRRLRLELHRD